MPWCFYSRNLVQNKRGNSACNFVLSCDIFSGSEQWHQLAYQELGDAEGELLLGLELEIDDRAYLGGEAPRVETNCRPMIPFLELGF